MSHPGVKNALNAVEHAWLQMQNVKIDMSPEKFERKIDEMSALRGITYSKEKGRWLDNAKKVLADPNAPQKEKNLIIAEVGHPKLNKHLKDFAAAFNRLNELAEFAYEDIKVFLEDGSKDERLKTFLKFRAFPVAMLFHKIAAFSQPVDLSKADFDIVIKTN